MKYRGIREEVARIVREQQPRHRDGLVPLTVIQKHIAEFYDYKEGTVEHERLKTALSVYLGGMIEDGTLLRPDHGFYCTAEI